MTSKTERPPTAHDVARSAGVSQSAVSRAFTEGASISAELKARILAAAAALGYRPNLLARSLNQRRSNLVGVVSGRFDNPFFALALDCFTEALADRGLRILLFGGEPNAKADEQVAQLLSHQVTGVILMAADLSSTLAAECARSGIPVVMFNRTVEGEHAAFAVTGDNAAGARAIARRFIETGRRRLAFMAGYDGSSTSHQREEAFRAAVAEAGLAAPLRVSGAYSRAGAIAATRELFAGDRDSPDALFCANDLMAIAAVEVLRADFGIEPGEGCAVAGFDDIPMAGWPSFDLTTYSQPLAPMVTQSVDYVCQTEHPGGLVVVPGELILRATA